LLLPGSDFLSVTGNVPDRRHAGAVVSLSARDSLNLVDGLEDVVFHSGLTAAATPPSRFLGYERKSALRTTLGGRLSYQHTITGAQQL